MKTIKQLLSSLIHKSFRAGVLANLNNSQGETDLDAALEDRDKILEVTEEMALTFTHPIMDLDMLPWTCLKCGGKTQVVRPGKSQCVSCG